eukprot:gene8079-12540_t
MNNEGIDKEKFKEYVETHPEVTKGNFSSQEVLEKFFDYNNGKSFEYIEGLPAKRAKSLEPNNRN